MFYCTFFGLVVSVATAYQLSCPVKSQWHFLQQNCTNSAHYTCLFNDIRKRYETECSSREYLAKDGSKKIRMPGITDGNCTKDRYQPVTFNASQSSDCLYLKSGCEEEGQVLVSNGASNLDRTCRCDYRAGYTYVIPPRNQCACVPSVDDCSCRKIYCNQNEALSQDYKCEEKEKLLLTVCKSISDITVPTGKGIVLDPSLLSHTPPSLSGKIASATVFVILVVVIMVVVLLWLREKCKMNNNEPSISPVAKAAEKCNMDDNKLVYDRLSQEAEECNMDVNKPKASQLTEAAEMLNIKDSQFITVQSFKEKDTGKIIDSDPKTTQLDKAEGRLGEHAQNTLPRGITKEECNMDVNKPKASQLTEAAEMLNIKDSQFITVQSFEEKDTGKIIDSDPKTTQLDKAEEECNMDVNKPKTSQLTEAAEMLIIKDSQFITVQSFKEKDTGKIIDSDPKTTQLDKAEGNTKDNNESRPLNPVCLAETNNSISLFWDEPLKGSTQTEQYEIKYKECRGKGGKWNSLMTEAKMKCAKVENLRSTTEYEFKIRCIYTSGDEGPFSELIKSSTVESLATRILTNADLVKKGTPSLYKLHLKHNALSTNEGAKTRKCIFGPENPIHKREKTIMLVGATGAGKSTLIDGMINYITGVSWEDDFRFTLVDLTDEEKARAKHQTESQTEWITCYAINKFDKSNIGYNLNIIDTPGFGDTRGIDRDKKIVDQIRKFFTTPDEKGITCLDAVCFVTQAPLARLTATQNYVFNSILSVFGQDIRNNIYVLITFADGNTPPVCGALIEAEVPFQKYFKFNNSALFAQSTKTDEAGFGSLFWKMGHDSFQIFFNDLEQVNPISLQLTTEVLKLRKSLEAAIQGLQPQIEEGMNNLNTIRKEQEVLKRHKTDIEANRNFNYEVEEIHMRRIDLDAGEYVTNCMTCNRTCHYPCHIPGSADRMRCAALDQNGFCIICPFKCKWQVHENNSFRFETFPVKVKKTYDELKEKYETASKGEEKHRSALSQAKSAFNSLGKQVMKMVQEVRGYINKLNEIALRPNPLSDVEYIDVLIESERREKKYGWETRVKLYQDMRKEAELMSKATNENYVPWNDEDILDDIC